MQRRGMSLDLTGLQLIAQQQRSLEEQRNTLQAEGNRIGREMGQRIRAGTPCRCGANCRSCAPRGTPSSSRCRCSRRRPSPLAPACVRNSSPCPTCPPRSRRREPGEADNVEVKRWGEPRRQADLPQEHWQIAERLSLLDTERSVRIAQSRFVTLTGQGARLERALVNFMLDLHTGKGYQELLPPILVNSASLTGSGQLPKFAEESFRCADDDLWLTPTAEVPLTSFHRDEVIAAERLPLRYVAFTPCFRREAGSYGRDTRGLIRLHQFHKVELYWFTRPDQSEAGPRTAHPGCRGGAGGPGAALPPDGTLQRRSGLLRRPHLRPGGVAGGGRGLPGDLQLQHLR